MSTQTYLNPDTPLFLSNFGVDQVRFKESSAPPLSLLDQHNLWVDTVDDGLYYDADKVVTTTGGLNIADQLATTTTPVDVYTAPKPNVGEVMQADTDHSILWTPPEASLLRSATTLIDIESAVAPVAEQVLEAIDGVSAQWIDPSAAALRTTGAKVDISLSAPPGGADYILQTSDATHAVWTDASALVNTSSSPVSDNSVVRYDNTTGTIIQDSPCTISDTGVLDIPLAATYSIDGTDFLSTSNDKTNTYVGRNTLNPNALTNCTHIGCLSGVSSAVGAANNTLCGVNSGISISTGTRNTVMGSTAATQLTTQSSNSIYGYNCAAACISDNNTICGSQTALALTTGSDNVIYGQNCANSLVSGSNNIIIKSGGITTGDGNICIDAGATVDPIDNDAIYIGENHTSAFFQGIFSQTSAGATAVVVNAAGKLGTIVSSSEFKENISALVKDTETIFGALAVKKYNLIGDPNLIEEYGLIAQDVELIDADLCTYKADGTTLLSVDYHKLLMLAIQEIQRLNTVVAGLLP